MEHQPGESSSRSAGRAPFTDPTNNVNNQSPKGQKQQTGKGWYARLSPEQKAEYLQRLRIARQQKKDATRGGLRIVDVSRSSQTSQQILEDTLLTKENISQLSGISNMENRPGSASNQIPRGSIKPAGQGWYARLTPQKKADYLQRQRIARQEKKVANHIGVNSVDTSHRSPASVTNSLHTPFSNITNTQTNGVRRVTLDKKQKGVMLVEGSQKSATTGVCQGKPLGFWPSQIKTLMTREKAQKTLCTGMCCRDETAFGQAPLVGYNTTKSSYYIDNFILL